MKTIFVSYARVDAGRVADLAGRLRQLGHDVWLDTDLRGGQAWWDEILARIAHCDVFVAVISQASLTSVACTAERDFAIATQRPVLPVAVERFTQALPREISLRQVVDYSGPGQDAAFALAAALGSMAPAPPVPEPLPAPPPAPLSYLTDLYEVLRAPELTKAQQRSIIDQIEPAMRSTDEDERAGAVEVLEMLEARPDLYVDVARRLSVVRSIPTDVDGDGHVDARTTSAADGGTVATIARVDEPSATANRVTSSDRSRWLAIAAVVGVAAVAAGTVLWVRSSNGTVVVQASPTSATAAESPVAGPSPLPAQAAPCPPDSSPSAGTAQSSGPLQAGSVWKGVLTSDPFVRNGAEVINSLDVEMTFSSVLPDGRLRTVVEWTSPRSKATATYLACGRIEGNGAVFLQGDSWISQPFKAATLDTYWLTLSGDSMKGRYQGTSYDPADPLLKGDAGTAELRLSR